MSLFGLHKLEPPMGFTVPPFPSRPGEFVSIPGPRWPTEAEVAWAEAELRWAHVQARHTSRSPDPIERWATDGSDLTLDEFLQEERELADGTLTAPVRPKPIAPPNVAVR